MTSSFCWYLSPKHKKTEYIIVYREAVQQTVTEQQSQEVNWSTSKPVSVARTLSFPWLKKALYLDKIKFLTI